MNQASHITSEEISEDERDCMVTSDENNLHNVEFPKAVLDTHKAMSEAIEARMQDKTGQLRFYSDYTGRGKTTGAILTIGIKISDPNRNVSTTLRQWPLEFRLAFLRLVLVG